MSLEACAGDAVLYLGDCIEEMQSMPDDFAHAIVTDPPYGLGDFDSNDVLDALFAWLAGEPYTPKGRGGFMGKAWDAFVPGPEAWREAYRVLKPGGHLLCFAGTRTVDLMTLAIRLAGFEVRDSIEWLYGQSGERKSGEGGRKVRTRPASTDLGVHNDDGWQPKEVDQISYGDAGGASRFFYVAKASRAERDAGLDDAATRTFNRTNPGGLENDPRWAPTQVKNHHPTVKPIALMRWLVRLVTPPGGLVLDPFMGSGSTGCAAAAEGLMFAGIERDPDYFEIARRRIEHASNASADALRSEAAS